MLIYADITSLGNAIALSRGTRHMHTCPIFGIHACVPRADVTLQVPVSGQELHYVGKGGEWAQRPFVVLRVLLPGPTVESP